MTTIDDFVSFFYLCISNLNYMSYSDFLLVANHLGFIVLSIDFSHEHLVVSTSHNGFLNEFQVSASSRLAGFKLVLKSMIDFI